MPQSTRFAFPGLRQVPHWQENSCCPWSREAVSHPWQTENTEDSFPSRSGQHVHVPTLRYGGKLETHRGFSPRPVHLTGLHLSPEDCKGCVSSLSPARCRVSQAIWRICCLKILLGGQVCLFFWCLHYYLPIQHVGERSHVGGWHACGGKQNYYHTGLDTMCFPASILSWTVSLILFISYAASSISSLYFNDLWIQILTIRSQVT